MFKGGKEAKVAYPVEGMGPDVAGRSFHHGRFVMKMRQAAAACPTVTVRQGMVKRLINGGCVVCCVVFRIATERAHTAAATAAFGGGGVHGSCIAYATPALNFFG